MQLYFLCFYFKLCRGYLEISVRYEELFLLIKVIWYVRRSS